MLHLLSRERQQEAHVNDERDGKNENKTKNKSKDQINSLHNVFHLRANEITYQAFWASTWDHVQEPVLRRTSFELGHVALPLFDHGVAASMTI